MKTKPPLERHIVEAIKKFMRDNVGATVHKNHGGAFGERGLPDLFGTLPGGRAYYIEVKRPGRLATLTPVQMATLQREAMHGAVAGYATSAQDVADLLDLHHVPYKPLDK